MNFMVNKIKQFKENKSWILVPIIKNPIKSLVAIYLLRALSYSYDNQNHIPETTYISRSQVELVWVTRALTWDSLNLQVRDTLTWVLVSNGSVVSEWSGDKIANILLWWANISLDMLTWNKYIVNKPTYSVLLDKMPDQRSIFRFRNGQIWEWHCPLYAMKSAIYATSWWSLNIEIDTLWNELWFDFETKTWYWQVRNMADLIQSYVKDCEFTTDRTMRPTLERIDRTISNWWVAVVNVLSQWWYMHRVTIVGQIDGKYIIINSWRTMFDKNKEWMRSIGPFEPFATYKISTWTLQLVPKNAFEYNIYHSLEQNYRSWVLKELTFWAVYGAAIFVEKKWEN